ncbi:MAG: hypothetical protein S4CHLAM102_05990 [Chlamydiia bacterium]|nr:hypothetical protein [Chlamydiia bacterium]
MRYFVLTATLALCSSLTAEVEMVAPEKSAQELIADGPVIAAHTLSAKGFTLNVPEEKKQAISELLITMGENSPLKLGFKKAHLQSLGKQIHGLPTLQFLAYVFSEEKLSEMMVLIHQSSFKWKPLITGMSNGLTKADEHGDLEPKLAGFAKFVNVDYSVLKKKADAKDWEGFVVALIQNQK